MPSKGEIAAFKLGGTWRLRRAERDLWIAGTINKKKQGGELTGRGRGNSQAAPVARNQSAQPRLLRAGGRKARCLGLEQKIKAIDVETKEVRRTAAVSPSQEEKLTHQKRQRERFTFMLENQPLPQARTATFRRCTGAII